MTWEVDDQDFEIVLSAGPDKQYDYFVGHAADQEQVWSLAVGGTDWALIEDRKKGWRFALWPHPRFAEACRHGHWEHREPTPIGIYALVDELIPQLIQEGTGIALFPLPDGRFTPVSPRRLRSDLEAALTQYE